MRHRLPTQKEALSITPLLKPAFAGHARAQVMDYAKAFSTALARIRSEGRYRVFADLKWRRGQFPKATWTRDDGATCDVTVWCSNDYLGQGHVPETASLAWSARHG